MSKLKMTAYECSLLYNYAKRKFKSLKAELKTLALDINRVAYTHITFLN